MLMNKTIINRTLLRPLRNYCSSSVMLEFIVLARKAHDW